MKGIHISAVFCKIFSDGEHLLDSSHHGVSWWLAAVLIYYLPQAKCWLFSPQSPWRINNMHFWHIFNFAEKDLEFYHSFSSGQEGTTLTPSCASTHALLFWYLTKITVFLILTKCFNCLNIDIKIWKVGKHKQWQWLIVDLFIMNIMLIQLFCHIWTPPK